MISPRKKVRDAFRTALQHATSGFNAQVLAAATDHGIDAFEIDWSEGSRQFLQGYFDADAVELSQLFDYPCLVLYTSQASHQPDREKFRNFAGDVIANLDFYVQFREGRELDNTEPYGECFEDALLQMMASCRSVFEDGGAYWNGDIEIIPSNVVQYANGWAQRISATLTFEVTV